MVTHYGMSESLGLATFEKPPASVFLDVPLPQQRPEYSERTAQVIDEEIRNILAAAQERVRQTLGSKRALLDALAKKLLAQEVVDRATLVELLGTRDEATAALKRAAFSRNDGSRFRAPY
jgi:cell division protease FtsH